LLAIHYGDSRVLVKKGKKNRGNVSGRGKKKEKKKGRKKKGAHPAMMGGERKKSGWSRNRRRRKRVAKGQPRLQVVPHPERGGKKVQRRRAEE